MTAADLKINMYALMLSVEKDWPPEMAFEVLTGDKLCITCRQYKSFNSFREHRDGRMHTLRTCSDCRAKQATGQKICRDCGKTMPFDCFHPSHYYHKGEKRTSYRQPCKDCYNRKENKRYHSKK